MFIYLHTTGGFYMQIQLSEHFTYKKLLRFVLPSIVMMIFTSIYGVVDGLFVSNYVGKTAFAAVNLIMPFLMAISALGFMIGTGVRCGQNNDKQEKREAIMIQDIYPMKLDNAFQMKEPDADSRILAFRDRTVYLKNEGEITFLKYHVWVEYCKTHHKKVPGLVYLFSVDDISFYLTELYEDVEIPGFMYHKLFAVRSMKPKERVFAATTAWHLYVWYRDNQFCGRCAHPLVHSCTERMLQCPVCNNMVFPKIAPAVIIGLTNNDQIMMTKYAGREYKRYALIAGFTEIGETAEETVHREVMEEVGLKVKNIRYYKSQPWGFDSNLLMGFFCDLAEEGEIRLEEEELSLAEWVDYRDVPDDPEGLSLTREMMTYFRKQREQGLNP